MSYEEARGVFLFQPLKSHFGAMALAMHSQSLFFEKHIRRSSRRFLSESESFQ
jgi:hypothetical protein